MTRHHIVVIGWFGGRGFTKVIGSMLHDKRPLQRMLPIVHLDALPFIVMAQQARDTRLMNARSCHRASFE